VKVALNIVNGDGTGKIRIYEVDADAFYDYLYQLSPSAEEDWWNLANWVEENGELCYETSPDYSITIYS
jgi:hypothetical protein